MKIEVGKYYRTEDGRKVGPMVMWSIDALHPFEVVDHPDGDLEEAIWTSNGEEFQPRSGLDIVEEWKEEVYFKEVDVYNIDKAWGELTDLEKGALLLHHHNGGIVEHDAYPGDDTFVTHQPVWDSSHVYRAKKEEPAVETVSMESAYEKGGEEGFTHPQCYPQDYPPSGIWGT